MIGEIEINRLIFHESNCYFSRLEFQPDQTKSSIHKSMYIQKRYPFLGVVRWSGRYLIYFIVIDTVPVLLYKFMDWDFMAIPWQPIALIGVGVSFYLGFKNNSSYDRLWEARKIWGGIVNASRSFAIMTRDFITNEFDKLNEKELNGIHKRIVHRHVAWLMALTYQMRMYKVWEHDGKADVQLRKFAGIHPDDNSFDKLKGYLTTEDFNYLMQKGNKASHLLSIQSKDFKDQKMSGRIDDFRHMELEKVLGELYSLQGKSERIKKYPFPRQYATINFLFVWIFVLLLPFGMLTIFNSSEYSLFSWLAIPFTVLVSWVFMLMEMIGDYSENPFEGSYNDVPITSMARSIEIDIRQMIDETDLPEEIKPVGDFQVLM